MTKKPFNFLKKMKTFFLTPVCQQLIKMPYEYAKDLDQDLERFWDYAKFLSKIKGFKDEAILNRTFAGYFDDDINLIRECLRGLVKLFVLSEDDSKWFGPLLEYDQSCMNDKQQLARVDTCLEMLRKYTNVSRAVKDSIFMEDDSELTIEDFDFKYGLVVE